MGQRSPAGPVTGGLVVVSDLAAAALAYTRWLHLEHRGTASIDAAFAAALGRPELAGAATAQLGPVGGDGHWLELVEDPEAVAIEAFHPPGWMALEVCVQGVDGFGASLRESPFAIAGEPANLAVGDAIRAMQVIGPGGEILYLTEIFDDLPPFELPRARFPVDQLFIPVLAASELDATLAFLEDVLEVAALRFDTRLGSLSRALGRDPESLYPVATMQLSGACLFEIDQLPGAPAPRPLRSQGIAAITLQTADAERLAARSGAMSTRQGVVLIGPDGERIVLTPAA
ncbi:MAG: hypothetical protein AAGE01_23090 [Pseudomonadota bacterium]